MPDPEKYFTAQLIVNQCFYNLLKDLSEKCPKKVLFMSFFCPTFEMSTKRNTSKTQNMTIQELFAKLSAPGQKRVSYGIWWAINKMNQCDTKSYCDNNWKIFTQWISYKNADFILPKLDGFKSLYNGYKCECIIDGNMVSVTYNTGMANGNVMVSVSIFDAEKANKQREEEEEKKREEEEEKKILMKMWRHMINYSKENKNAKNEDFIKEAEKFSEKEAEIFKRDLLKTCQKN